MKKHYNILLFSVFAFYILILCAILFFRHSHSSVNIVPFSSIASYLSGDNSLLRSFAFINVVGNIVLFIPMGIYTILFRHDKRLYTNVLLILLMSVSVEVVQYLAAVGVSDIDDVILNCFGGFIGIVVYKILLFQFKDENKVRNIITIGAPIGAIVCILINFIYNR